MPRQKINVDWRELLQQGSLPLPPMFLNIGQLRLRASEHEAAAEGAHLKSKLYLDSSTKAPGTLL